MLEYIRHQAEKCNCNTELLSRYLCRAKRIDNGEWVEGFYVLRPNEPGGGKHYIVTAGRCEWNEVDPSTICWCTGLKDKNGKLIWENDIVKDITVHSLGKVFYWRYEGRFAVNDVDDGKQLYTGEMWEDVEVIGNIFDNPELLEV